MENTGSIEISPLLLEEIRQVLRTPAGYSVVTRATEMMAERDKFLKELCDSDASKIREEVLGIVREVLRTPVDYSVVKRANDVMELLDKADAYIQRAKIAANAGAGQDLAEAITEAIGMAEGEGRRYQ